MNKPKPNEWKRPFLLFVDSGIKYSRGKWGFMKIRSSKEKKWLILWDFTRTCVNTGEAMILTDNMLNLWRESSGCRSSLWAKEWCRNASSFYEICTFAPFASACVFGCSSTSSNTRFWGWESPGAVLVKSPEGVSSHNTVSVENSCTKETTRDLAPKILAAASHCHTPRQTEGDGASVGGSTSWGRWHVSGGECVSGGVAHLGGVACTVGGGTSVCIGMFSGRVACSVGGGSSVGAGTSVGVGMLSGEWHIPGGLTLVLTWLMASRGQAKPKVLLLEKPLELQYILLCASFKGIEVKGWPWDQSSDRIMHLFPLEGTVPPATITSPHCLQSCLLDAEVEHFRSVFPLLVEPTNPQIVLAREHQNREEETGKENRCVLSFAFTWRRNEYFFRR